MEKAGREGELKGEGGLSLVPSMVGLSTSRLEPSDAGVDSLEGKERT